MSLAQSPATWAISFIFCPDFRGLRLLRTILHYCGPSISFFAPISGDYDRPAWPTRAKIGPDFIFCPDFRGLRLSKPLFSLAYKAAFIFCPDFRGLRHNLFINSSILVFFSFFAPISGDYDQVIPASPKYIHDIHFNEFN